MGNGACAVRVGPAYDAYVLCLVCGCWGRSQVLFFSPRTKRLFSCTIPNNFWGNYVSGYFKVHLALWKPPLLSNLSLLLSSPSKIPRNLCILVLVIFRVKKHSVPQKCVLFFYLLMWVTLIRNPPILLPAFTGSEQPASSASFVLVPS